MLPLQNWSNRVGARGGMIFYASLTYVSIIVTASITVTVSITVIIGISIFLQLYHNCK